METEGFVAQWLFDLEGNWYPADKSICLSLEKAFGSVDSASEIEIELLGKKWTAEVNMSDMMWRNIKMRRNAYTGNPNLSTVKFQFWDMGQQAWKDYNEFDNQHLADCLAFTRKTTTLFWQGRIMKIDLQRCTQDPISSGKTIPIRYEGFVCNPDCRISELLWSENTDVPSEYCCPITHNPMRMPVVASDGHTYEMESIKKWLTHSWKSPITNQTLLSSNLPVNHNLRKSMLQWQKDKTGKDVLAKKNALVENESLCAQFDLEGR